MVAICPRLYDSALCGLAINLGSITITVHLTDLEPRAVIASAGIMNPQIRFGEDLMSRLSCAMMNSGSDREMTSKVREAIGTLTVDVAKEAHINPSLILETIFGCNPIMRHLLLGIDPVELGLTSLPPSSHFYMPPCPKNRENPKTSF